MSKNVILYVENLKKKCSGKQDGGFLSQLLKQAPDLA